MDVRLSCRTGERRDPDTASPVEAVLRVCRDVVNRENRTLEDLFREIHETGSFGGR